MYNTDIYITLIILVVVSFEVMNSNKTMLSFNSL